MMAATRLALGSGWVATFQRFRHSQVDLIERPPSSLGALPVGRNAAGAWRLPLADDECFWIGLAENIALAPSMLALKLQLGDASLVDALSGRQWEDSSASELMLPGSLWLAGIRHHGAGPTWKVFSNNPHVPPGERCVALVFRLRACGEEDGDGAEQATTITRLGIVDYKTFSDETDIAAPAPLDNESAYEGWRLP